jgi:hypothetical protein
VFPKSRAPIFHVIIGEQSRCRTFRACMGRAAPGAKRTDACVNKTLLPGGLMDHGSQSPPPDDIEALRRRDCRAWEGLYNSQWEPLCAFIRAQLGEASAATVEPEEVALEVFCRAYTEITRFRGEARLETWLRSIARHTVMAMVRELSPERRP